MYMAICLGLLVVSLGLVGAAIFVPKWLAITVGALYTEVGLWQTCLTTAGTTGCFAPTKICNKMEGTRAVTLVACILMLVAATVIGIYLCSSVYSAYTKLMCKVVYSVAAICAVLIGVGMGLMYDECNVTCVLGLATTDWVIGLSGILSGIACLLLVGVIVLAWLEKKKIGNKIREAQARQARGRGRRPVRTPSFDDDRRVDGRRY